MGSLRHAEALRGKRTRAPAAFSSSTRASSPRFVRERTRTMARYEQLVADDEIAARDAAHVDIVAQQERAKKRKLFREKIERLLWVLVSAFLVWFGSLTVNMCVLVYLIARHNFHRRGSKWETEAAWTLPVSSLFGIASFCGFGVLLWPIYGWGTPIVEAVLCMGFLMFTYFMPSEHADAQARLTQKAKQKRDAPRAARRSVPSISAPDDSRNGVRRSALRTS